MKRKIILRLSFMIAFLTLLWSCRNEDFVQAEKNPQRNNADFFRHSKSGGANARTGVDYIAILEAYNREKNFLGAMPDQEGMPIWDKMDVVDAQDATGLSIPLSYDKETLSSILFVILDAQNTVVGTKNITNGNLEKIVYDKSYPKDYREMMMNNFIRMDYKVFGNQLFGNIPEDLYIGHKAESTRRLVYGGDKGGYAAAPVYNAAGKMLYVTICTTTYHCTHHGGGACDGCSACQTTSCTTTGVPVGDDGMGSGSSSGGGGGGGTPAPAPPKDPCTLRAAFYRLNPNCAGGGDSDPSINKECERLKADLQKAKTLINNTTIKNQNNTMKAGIVTDLNEKRFFFGKDANGVYQVSPIETLGTMGGSNSTTVYFTPEGDFHNHNGIEYPPCPSPGDIYGLNDYHSSFPTFGIRFVNGADGSLYTLTITNEAAFTQFITDHPKASTLNAENTWIKDSKIEREFRRIAQYFYNKGMEMKDYNAYAAAYVAKKFNMGIVISEKDANGDFRPLEIKEKRNQFDPENLDYELTHPCGL